MIEQNKKNTTEYSKKGPFGKASYPRSSQDVNDGPSFKPPPSSIGRVKNTKNNNTYMLYFVYIKTNVPS